MDTENIFTHIFSFLSLYLTLTTTVICLFYPYVTSGLTPSHSFLQQMELSSFFLFHSCFFIILIQYVIHILNVQDIILYSLLIICVNSWLITLKSFSKIFLNFFSVEKNLSTFLKYTFIYLLVNYI